MAKSNIFKAGPGAQQPTRRSDRTPKPAQKVLDGRTAAEKAYKTPESLSKPQSNANDPETTGSITVDLPYPTPPDCPASINGKQLAVDLFLESFPTSCRLHNVSGANFLCGLRALSTSLRTQHATVAEFEELREIAQDGQLFQREIEQIGFSQGSTSNYSADELSLILTIWCERNGRTGNDRFHLGWMTATGNITVQGPEETTEATEVVWIYSSFDGNDQQMHHYQGLGREHPIQAQPQLAASVGPQTRKRSAAAAFTATEPPAKKLRAEDDPEYDPSNEQTDTDDEDLDLFCLDDDEDPAAEGVSPANDETGLIRVGKQPAPSHLHDVRYAPRAYVDCRLGIKLSNAMSKVDSRFSSTTDEIIEQDKEELKDYLGSTITTSREDPEYVTRYCDYTGQQLLWSPGPFSPSIEAVLPFARSQDKIKYHVYPNVALVMTFLNMLKRQFGILVLPIAAAWLNARDTWERLWTSYAADNMAIAAVHFGCSGSHLNQINKWSKWDMNQQEAMLTTLRTGALTPTQEEHLARHSLNDLFKVTTGQYTLATCHLPTDFKKTLQKIADHYSISSDESDALCFIDNPAGDRVFYPFYYMSRDLAREIGWDWPMLYSFAQERLHRLRSACNKNAEKAGLGEPEMNPVRFIYWMAHVICRRIVDVKASEKYQADPSQEYIAHNLLDRWGFPIVPWRHHIFMASVCKLQDHGIAMLFGLRPCADGEVFDPVNGFDFDRCTITIDSVITNFAMGFSSTDHWPKILDALHTVPLQTPLWRPVSSLGMSRWRGASTSEIRPRPPTPAFVMPLIDIDIWIFGDWDDMSSQFYCSTCRERYDSIGQWIRHCREKHSDPSQELEPEDTDQLSNDKKYWDALLRCSVCSKAFNTSAKLKSHAISHSDERPFKCTADGCSYASKTPENLKGHVYEVHLKSKRFKCTADGCSYATDKAANLNTHVARVHTEDKPFKCLVDGCSQAFGSERDLVRHGECHSEDKPFACSVPGCTKAYKRKAELVRHIRTHKQFKCDDPGCSRSFDTQSELDDHSKCHARNRPFPCPVPGCTKAYTRKYDLDVHAATHNDERPFKCQQPGCTSAFHHQSGLTVHIRDFHNTGRTFKCLQHGCTDAFETDDQLIEHTKTHENEFPFKCPHCTKRYKAENSLKVHLRKGHAGDGEK